MELVPFAVVRDLLVALRAVDGRNATIMVALQVLQSRLATAGVAWVRDPAGRWRLLGTVGDEALVGATLVDEPLPRWEQAGVVDRHADGVTDALLRVRTSQGAPLALLRLIGAPVSEPQLEGLLDTAAELVGQVMERVQLQERLEESQRVAKIGSWEWLAASDEVWLSDQMYRNLGIRPEDFDHTLVGYLERVHPEDREVLSERVRSAMANGGAWYTVHRLVGADGQVRVLEGHGAVVLDEQGVGVRLLGTGQDISLRQHLEQELDRQAQRDEVTGLLNRSAFTERLRFSAHRGRISRGVVVLVDVDDFQAINRQLGWEAADGVLAEVAGRLREAVPETAAVARLVGDRFALLVEEVDAALGPAELGERIASRFEPAERLGGSPWPVTVRVGVAASGSAGRSGEELVREATIALEVADARTYARSHLFDAVQHGQALHRLAMESDLRHAVKRGEIEVAYQPILDASTGRVSGVEALARWERPGHGPVSPATFIPLAERAGLIRQLGEHVLARACRQLQTWTQTHPVAGDWHVAVNLSADQLDDNELVELVESTLADTGLAHDRLVLEVTETALSHDRPGALRRLFELRRRGVRIAIDDFGTGYSSLSRLRELPFDILKIDRAFIQGITDPDEAAPILEALFSITRALKLDVVAEGVETAIQLAKLKGHHCGFVQGFLFSRPLPAHEIEPLLGGEIPWDLAEFDGPVPEPDGSALQQLLGGLVHAGGVPTQDTVDQMLQILAELTGLDSVFLTRIDLGAGVQQIVAAANTATIEIEPGMQVAWAQTLWRRAIADGRHVIPDVAADHPDAEIFTRLGVRSYVGVEVHGAEGELRATLCGVSARPGDIPQDTVDGLKWAARLLADPLD